MTFGNTSLTWSAAAAGAASAAAVGLLIWWLLRKRLQRVWLPTVRVLQLEARLLPQLVLRPPPLLAFCCFFLSALALVGYSLRPSTQVFTPFAPDQSHIHVFCDLSPSVSAAISLDDYAAKVQALVDTLKTEGRLSLSTSASPEIREPRSGEEAALWLKSLGFHRSGLHLGEAVKQLLKDVAEIDRLVLVSDRDQHSWSGFNWRYLQDEMDVLLDDVASGSGPSGANVFISEARFLSQPNQQTMDWDVELGRRGDLDELSGHLEAVYMGQNLGTFAWHLGSGQQRLNVRLSWPASAVPSLKPAEAQGIALIFRVVVDGGDLLAADDEFRTQLRGVKQDVTIIAEAPGERLLEDPAGQLETSLEVLGFRIRRYDYLTPQLPALGSGLQVLLGGGGSGEARFCPHSLATERLAVWAGQAKAGGLAKVWLAPETATADYRELCRCYTSLLLSKSANEPPPAFCAQVTSRSQWVGLLPSLGAKPVGGSVNDPSKTLAYHQTDQRSGLEVLAFTVPLAPLPSSGINHAQMPILIKELLTWQGVIDGQGGQREAWPRVADIVQAQWHQVPPLTPEQLTQLRQSNVPLGESLLATAQVQDLPPRWSAQSHAQAKQLGARKDREDPLPWLQLAAAVAVAAAFFEGLVTLLLHGRRLLQRRSSKTGVPSALIVLIASGLWLAPRAEARIEFAVVGPGLPAAAAFSTLAKEVSRRTSIELSPSLQIFPRPTLDALSSPWLWSEGLAAVTTPAGELQTELATWLRRGGFLIIEAPWQQPQLQQLTKALTTGSEPGSGWQPLPPDHEVMRSFYLLDALPACNGEIWRGFAYDKRLAILAVPYGFLRSLQDQEHRRPPACKNAPDQERSVRVFINLIMVALATDYKRDQIHLPEILKRLR